MSNLVRRKMCAAIDGLYVEPNHKSKKFILFLPEGETHELLLLFTEYILRKHNHLVTYLGCSLPINELDFIASHLKPDFLVTYLTVSSADMSFGDYLKVISTTFPSSKILIGGAQLKGELLQLPANCVAIQSADDLLKSIA